MIEKRLAALPFSLSFWISSPWNGSEGARAPDLTKDWCLGSVRSGRPIRLKWGPAKFSYGFRITRLVLTSMSFLATIPLWFWEKGSSGDLKWGLQKQGQPGVQGQENASRACAELPRMIPYNDCLLGLLPRLPGSGMNWPPKDSLMSAPSSQRRMSGGSLAEKQNPLAASGLAEVLSLVCAGPMWARPSISCPLTVAPQVSSNSGN